MGVATGGLAGDAVQAAHRRRGLLPIIGVHRAPAPEEPLVTVGDYPQMHGPAWAQRRTLEFRMHMHRGDGIASP
jgi:hypothetical protein